MVVFWIELMAIFLAGAGKRGKGGWEVTRLSGVKKLYESHCGLARPSSTLCGCILPQFWNGRCCCLENVLYCPPLLQYMNCLCCVCKNSHWRILARGSVVNLWEQQSCSFCQRIAACPPPRKEKKKRKKKTRKAFVSLFCFYLTSIAYHSPIVKKDIYLNSGLTSTKNYGKTILTKVGEHPLRRAGVWCMCLFVGDVFAGVVMRFCAPSAASCWLSDGVRSLETGM